MEEGLRLVFFTLFAMILIIVIISLKLIVFSFVMSKNSLTKKKILYKSDDLIVICYIFFAYTLILFFKNGEFIKSLLAIIYFVGAIILLSKESFKKEAVIVFLLTVPCVYFISSSIIPDYNIKNDAVKGGVFQGLLIAEAMMTILVAVCTVFLFNIKTKIRFFVYSIVYTVIVYIVCVLLLIIAYNYSK